MSLGKRIRDLRKEKGLNQNELASKAGISNTYLSDIEIGRTSPSLRTLSKISKALKIDMATLFKP